MADNNWRDILNKEWSKSIPTLTTEEIQKMITLAFYQLFLVEVHAIKITSDIDSNGHYITFNIEGEAFKDSIDEYIEEDEEV